MYADFATLKPPEIWTPPEAGPTESVVDVNVAAPLTDKFAKVPMVVI
jgi:hypothetical protein